MTSTCIQTCHRVVHPRPLSPHCGAVPSLTMSINSSGDRTPHEPYFPVTRQCRRTRHASKSSRASHSIADQLRPANAASLRWRAVHRLSSSTMPLHSGCGAQTSCARPNAVKERQRKLQRIECATSTMTPRASGAIEHGSLPQEFLCFHRKEFYGPLQNSAFL